MLEYNLDRARAAECEGKARTARNDDDKHSWLAFADSWLQTAELRQILERLEQEPRSTAA
jgi:hypothetical protein